MYSKAIQESTTRRCNCCRKRDDVENLFKHEGRWYHKEVCGKIHPLVNEQVKEIESEFVEYLPTNIEFKADEPISEKKTYVITSAVSNVPVHDKCLKVLQEVTTFYNAELVVVPIKYNHQHNVVNVWDSKIKQYMCKKNLALNENLTLNARVNINPTAVRPLSGLEVYCGESSGIFAHSKLEVKGVPTPLDELPKLMYTTGTVTCSIFSPTKAGEKGYAAHSLGGLIVEVVDNKIFHIRHLIYAQDIICDLGFKFTTEGVEVNTVKGLVLGDAHFKFIDPKVYSAIFLGEESLIKQVRPSHLVWHDLLDFYAGSHHHKLDPFQRTIKHEQKHNDIGKEVKACLNFIKMTSKRHNAKNIIVGSNHHDHLDRWLKETDWRTDEVNARFYLETAIKKLNATKFIDGYGTSSKGAFEVLAEEQWQDVDYEFVYDDKSYIVGKTRVNFHGDKGANGSKGSAMQYGRSGFKYFTGHTHSPGVVDNCWTVGTMRYLNAEYVRGLSSMLNTMGLIYENDTHALINIIEGRFQG